MEHERSSNPYDNMDEYFENELDKLRQASGVDMSSVTPMSLSRQISQSLQNIWMSALGC